jgi:hypothetical protein
LMTLDIVNDVSGVTNYAPRMMPQVGAPLKEGNCLTYVYGPCR